LDDRVWRNISIGLGVVCALLIAVAGVLLVVGHKGGGSQSTPASTATQIAAASTPASTASDGTGTTPTVTIAPQSAKPTLVPGTAPAATITFSNLALDSSKDPLYSIRTFTFTSDGAGSVIPSITKISSGGYVKMCLSADGGKPNCPINRPNKGLTITGAKADKTPNNWTVPLVGYKTSHPTVTVSFTWPTTHPKITMAHGRFQGNPGTRTAATDALGGITATFQPRGVGTADVEVNWSIVTTDATMTLKDVSASPAVLIDERNYSSVDQIQPPFTQAVDGTKAYQVQLVRTGADSTDRPDLTVQISFP